MLFSRSVVGAPRDRHADDYIVRTAVTNDDSENPVFESVIAAQDLGVDLKRMDTSRFVNNPTVLWSHNSFEPPIGRSLELRREASTGSWISRFQFAPDNERADELRGLWERDYLRAMSIGFTMTKDADGRSVPLLHEHSLVDVGMDDMALKRVFPGVSVRSENGMYIISGNEIATSEERDMADETTAAEEPSEDSTDASDKPKTEDTTDASDKPDTDTTDVADRAAPAVVTRETLESIKRGLRAEMQERMALETQCRGLVPSGFDITGANDRSLLEAAVGEEVADKAKRSDDYLRGALEQIVKRREAARRGAVIDIPKDSQTRTAPNPEIMKGAK